MNTNNMQLIQFIKNSQNPQQLIMNMVQQQVGSNPLFSNIINLAQQGKTKEIENIARNMLKEKGLDFDKEFNSFRQQFGL